MTPTSKGNHCSGWTLPNFQFGSCFCSTTWKCSLSQLSRPMPCRHYISWKHRLWRASPDYGAPSAARIRTERQHLAAKAASAAQIRTGRRDLAAKAARMPPKRRDGTERRRARGATHTVVWRTWARIKVENVTYVEHPQQDRFSASNQGAPNATRSERFGT